MIPTTSVLAGLVILTGLVGIAVPVLPGLILVWASVLVWALVIQDPVSWWVLAISTVLLAAGWIAQYLWPGRRLKAAGVPGRTTLIGVIVGVVGFFVIPVLGLPLGFVLGVYLAETVRLGAAAAWPSSVHAMKAALLSYGIELGAGLLIALTWLVGVWRLVF